MRVVSVINQKGGAGKSTTVMNLASVVAEHSRVLVVDVDPQRFGRSGGRQVASQCAQVIQERVVIFALPIRIVGRLVIDPPFFGILDRGRGRHDLDLPVQQPWVVRAGWLDALEFGHALRVLRAEPIIRVDDDRGAKDNES